MTSPRSLGPTPWQLEPGSLNTICDVPGVLVGHRTIREDTPAVARTGVTVILPPADLPIERLPAAGVVFNGTGEMTGLHQVNEWGQLETPIALTGTAALPLVLQGMAEHMLERCAALGRTMAPCLPIVAECNDMWLSDAREIPVGPQHVREAIAAARGDQKEWGSVGAGTGMVSFGFRGGIGSASRRITIGDETFHLGTVCLVNFGQSGDLIVLGQPMGHLPGEVVRRPQAPPPPDGSLIAVLATDAPLDHLQLRRIAARASLGMARVGSYGRHGSGDIFIAFSTVGQRDEPDRPFTLRRSLRADLLTDFFRAAVETTEEGILHALFAASDETGFLGRHVAAVPEAEVRTRLGRQAGGSF